MSKKNILTLIFIIILIVIVVYVLGIRTSVAPVRENQIDSNTQATSSSTSTLYSLLDISKHNKSTDCWMAINGKVLNVTAFIASGQHNPKIINGCGIDATSIFSQIDKHKGQKAQDLMGQFIIGVLK